jgi:predicted ribosomally synthesized peptide with nif11-like leader
MSLDHIKEFLQKMQANQDLKNEVLSASTADDVARIAMRLGYEFSGDELLRFSGQKVGKVTVRKNDIPGEYN